MIATVPTVVLTTKGITNKEIILLYSLIFDIKKNNNKKMPSEFTGTKDIKLTKSA